MSSHVPSILIVDDEPGIREILQDLFEDLGRIVCVENGAQALEELQKSPFDLVITDYNMPVLNGCGLLLRARELGLQVPMIWITGRSTQELREDIKNVGVYAYFEKPFPLDDIRKTVIECLAVK
jgi:CheY-like chemotaxis protein